MADNGTQGNITAPNAADLNTAARTYAASKGWAMKDGSYPIRPANMHGASDLSNAIKAVGRGGASHNAIRQHIISRAKAIGMSDQIPDSWSADGTSRSVPNETERRFTPGLVEVRTTSDGGKRIGGYAAVFGKLSRNLGGFVELVNQSAFNESRMDGFPEVVARYNHDDMMLLGTTAAGTLRLGVDTAGLDYSVAPPPSRSDVLELVERGDVRKSSFAFRVMSGGDEWTTTEQGYPMRTLTNVQLVDVAPVVSPAYTDSTVGLRSLAEYAQADVEEIRQYAEADDLRHFFVRTDTNSTAVKATKKIFGPAALAQLRAKHIA